MDDQNLSLKGIIQKAKEYIKNWKELSQLVFVERVSSIISGLLLDVFLVILGLIAFLFLSISLALYLSEVTGSGALGFLITSGIYILIIAILAALKPKIENKLINLSIKKFLKKWNDNDEE
ncbi:MAG TPA: phage holin family protein [Sphingobacteriaceae bacterium]|nr:phage holin family protein [Sphingobacteriaceae bacterium]